MKAEMRNKTEAKVILQVPFCVTLTLYSQDFSVFATDMLAEGKGTDTWKRM